MDAAGFSGWLRGFVEGAGDSVLTAEKVTRIYHEAAACLAVQSSNNNAVINLPKQELVKTAKKVYRKAHTPDQDHIFGDLPNVTLEE